ncbi:hypothetical protein BH20ACT5_BH20ACT5_03550 [soil metagenome]
MAEQAERDEQQDAFADRFLGYVEDVIYWGVAVVLVAGALVVLGAQVLAFGQLGDGSVKMLMVEVLDGLLLVFIFVELLFAVRATLRSREIVAEPFLVIGLIVAIKEIVVLSVEAADLLDDGPQFARAITEVGVLGGLVLLLSVAMLMLRLRRQEQSGDVAEEVMGAADDAADAEEDLAQADRDRARAGDKRSEADERSQDRG